MKRTTIQAEPELLEKARVTAAAEGVSISELVRQGLEMRLRNSQPKPRVFGIASSGHKDTSQKATERAPAR